MFSPNASVPVIFIDCCCARYGLPGLEYPGLIKLALHDGKDVTADTRCAALLMWAYVDALGR